MIGRSPVPICACLGAFYYLTRCFESNVPFDNTTPIYLINLLWKLGLGFGLDLELHYFSILTENKESEHFIFREFLRTVTSC